MASTADFFDPNVELETSPPPVGKLIKLACNESALEDVTQISQDCFSAVSYYQEIVNQWFDGSCTFTDNHVAEQLFSRRIRREDQKNWIKFHLLALIGALARLGESLKNKPASSHGNPNKLIATQVELLSKIAIESVTILEFGEKVFNDNDVKYDAAMVKTRNSLEIWTASQDLYRNFFLKDLLGLRHIDLRQYSFYGRL